VEGIEAAMVERAERDPTMEEIVLALRETRKDAGRAPPFTVVGDHPDSTWGPTASLRGGENRTVRLFDEAASPRDDAGSTDIAELRDAEIERLLVENARLNERVVFLLKVIEREQRRNLALSGGPVVEMDRSAVARDVKAALEAELRPILLVLLRLLEARQADPAASAAAPAPTVEVPRAGRVRSPTSGSPGGGILLLDRRRDR
jgi:hypothetical protein